MSIATPQSATGPAEPRTLSPTASLTGLAEATSIEDLAQLWLGLQMAQVGAEAGAVFVQRGAALAAVAARGPVPLDAMEAVAANAMAAGRATVLRDADDLGALVGQPLTVPDRRGAGGGVVLRVTPAIPSRLRGVVQSLGWSSGWLVARLCADARNAAASEAERLAAANLMLSAVQKPRAAKAAALALTTALAQHLHADRVSVGLRRFGRTEVLAISHTAEFGKRLQLARLIVAAMDEALAQRAALSWPEPLGEVNATRAQAALSRDRGGAAILSVPFRAEGDLWRGCLSLERRGEQPFTAADTALADAVAALAGPSLWDKAENDRWLVAKVARTLHTQTVRLFGPGFVGRKLALAGILAATLLFSTWSATYRVTADATVEGAVERSIVAPFDGFLRSAPYTAGDRVAAGVELAALDDRDLVLERLRWMTERRQRDLELGRAIGERNRADVELIRARIAESDAQIALAEEQIARARLLAPFDGLIVSGDQGRNIGSAVRQGEVLFEFAPLDALRVVLDVDEAAVGDLAAGQTGELLVAGVTGAAMPIEFERITPVAVPGEGRNRFRAEARLVSPEPDLRHGMSGVAKIDIGRRLVIDIWTRPLRDWARLALWRWFG